MATSPVKLCSLCLGETSSSVSVGPEMTLTGRAKKSETTLNHLRGYLLHTNVREATTAADGDQQPKFTFTFSAGETVKTGKTVKDLDLCDACCVELEKLDKLHQELEAVKRKIGNQMERIERRRDKCSEVNKILFAGAPKLEMSIAGAVVVGKFNILQTLQFLGNICNGMSSRSSEKWEPPPPPVSDAPILPNANDVDTCRQPPGSSIDNPEANSFDVDGALQIEVGEVFTEVIKTETVETSADAGPFSRPPESKDNLQSEWNNAEDEDVPEDSTPLVSPSPVAKSSRGRILKPKPGSKNVISDLKRPVKSSKPNKDDDEKNHQCKICKRLFRHQGSMVRHQRVHTGEKAYQCKICDKRFGHGESLKNHQLVHTGERPYACHRCDQRFARKDNLEYHVLRKHAIIKLI